MYSLFQQSVSTREDTRFDPAVQLAVSCLHASATRVAMSLEKRPDTFIYRLW
jgi:hypothetical protein